ncbi:MULTISPECIES: PspA/IM30 family protein [unclassified Ruegeria]|uniref:PspA/IM30 family protein n=1 Tax=unclassified Ruegeria TaxID=2625375 RepID=UPI001490BA8F|nr:MULTISPECIES: PspA/IM30 family protein [unclassified Ruegeria]NOD78897.1 PspA/IM30 family protein [Ruegeria sp. HKCCD4332]NOD89443.1 PspA/IM30 family protein [Ruegeria sp. HKCCD4318]NOE13766.1 PspA/IM30 family protein [Ruegeria sp. HKCCD4318-2]NOG08299.1 PspA/IM30 family protein [Ruegeria sp. HKCCD4315]
MFNTLKTLMNGANARAEDRLRDSFSIELIDQKIREADQNLKAAKLTLASLIQKQRGETRQIETLQARIQDLMDRTRQALADDQQDLVQSAAQAVADLENELALRQQTVDRLEARILQLRHSVQTANRRILDLKQGAISARAVKREQGLQKRLNRHLGGTSPAEEAEELIARVMSQDDPFEQSEILREIDAGLDHSTVAQRMEEAGYGPKTRSSAAEVLSRLKAQS